VLRSITRLIAGCRKTARRAACHTPLGRFGVIGKERDLVQLFGDEYRRYQERVSMLLPWRN
jgi:protein-S-isoprenylcysteine O-methyltransferase Ste14